MWNKGQGPVHVVLSISHLPNSHLRSRLSNVLLQSGGLKVSPPLHHVADCEK